VKTSEYLDMIAADAKEQPIGETAEAGPARLALDDRKLERVIGEPDVQGLELVKETRGQAGGSARVPIRCVSEFRRRQSRQDDPHQG
jgi:hypothetical protein